MLTFCAFSENNEVFFGERLVDERGAAGFTGAFFSTDGAGNDGADDLLKRGSVVGSDPVSELQEFGRDEGFGIDEVREIAKGEVTFGGFVDPQYGAGSRTVAKRDTDAAAGENIQLIRDRVIED